MTRRILTFLTGVIVVSALATAADEPPPDQTDAPLRLKKKDKKDKDDKKDDKKAIEKKEEKKDEKKPDDMPGPITKDGEPLDNEADEKELLERVGRNMKAVEDRLVNKEINEGTRQLQDDIVKDLDALIRSAENPQGGDQANEDPQGGENKQGQQDKSKGASKKSGQKGPGQQKGQKGQQKQPGQGMSQQARGGEKREQGNGNPMGQGQDKGNSQNPGQNPGAGNSKDNPGDPNRDADVYKDAWGHLPETLRAQMNAYASREKYMDKHQDLIKQYYKTIAAQGRRKGE